MNCMLCGRFLKKCLESHKCINPSCGLFKVIIKDFDYPNTVFFKWWLFDMIYYILGLIIGLISVSVVYLFKFFFKYMNK